MSVNDRGLRPLSPIIRLDQPMSPETGPSASADAASQPQDGQPRKRRKIDGSRGHSPSPLSDFQTLLARYDLPIARDGKLNPAERFKVQQAIEQLAQWNLNRRLVDDQPGVSHHDTTFSIPRLVWAACVTGNTQRADEQGILIGDGDVMSQAEPLFAAQLLVADQYDADQSIGEGSLLHQMIDAIPHEDREGGELSGIRHRSLLSMLKQLQPHIDEARLCSTRDANGRSILAAAMQGPGDRTLRTLIDAGIIVIGQRTALGTISEPVESETGNTLLHLAYRASNLAAAELLIARGANQHARNDKGQTMLLSALAAGADVDTIKHLVSIDDDIFVTDKDGETAMHHAARMGSVEVIRYLCDKTRNSDQYSGFYSFGIADQTPMDVAADWRQGIAPERLANHADPASDPSIAAIIDRQINCLFELHNQNLSGGRIDPAIREPIHHALVSDDPILFAQMLKRDRRLIERQSDMGQLNEFAGRYWLDGLASVLHTAARYASLNTMKAVLAALPDAFPTGSAASHYPTTLAAQCNADPRVLQLLVNTGKSKPQHGFLQLQDQVVHHATLNPNPAVLKSLIEMGVSLVRSIVNEEEDRTTPLHWAAAHATPEVLKLLLDSLPNNFDGHQSSGIYGPPVSCAVQFSKYPEVIRLLVTHSKSRASVNSVDGQNWTPLNCATYAGNTEFVKTLLALGANENAVTFEYGNPVPSGKTAFELALRRDNLENIIRLTPKRLDFNVNQPLAHSLTPLMIIVQASIEFDSDVDQKISELITNLIDHHQWRFDATGNNRLTALDYAIACRPDSPIVANLLARHIKAGGLPVRPTDLANAFQKAVENCTASARDLLANPTQINQKDDWGRTPLHRLINVLREVPMPSFDSFYTYPKRWPEHWQQWLKVIEDLIDAGADLTIADARGETPLSMLAATQDAELIAGIWRTWSTTHGPDGVMRKGMVSDANSRALLKQAVTTWPNIGDLFRLLNWCSSDLLNERDEQGRNIAHWAALHNPSWHVNANLHRFPALHLEHREELSSSERAALITVKWELADNQGKKPSDYVRQKWPSLRV